MFIVKLRADTLKDFQAAYEGEINAYEFKRVQN